MIDFFDFNQNLSLSFSFLYKRKFIFYEINVDILLGALNFTEVKISFEQWVNKLGMPLIITGDGKLCFLIDTGASYNVLLKEAYLRLKSEFAMLGKHDYLLGMVGDPQRIFMVSGKIDLGGTLYDTEFGVLDSTDAMNNVKILTGLQIDGALGVDFLTKYGIILDFKRNEMRLAEEK